MLRGDASTSRLAVITSRLMRASCEARRFHMMMSPRTRGRRDAERLFFFFFCEYCRASMLRACLIDTLLTTR